MVHLELQTLSDLRLYDEAGTLGGNSRKDLARPG
jgi:hypothetical protein